MNRIIGNKIRSIRNIRSYSQEYVASKLGISQNAYSKIERGETAITDRKLNMIAEVFDVTKEEILNYNDDFLIKTKALTNIEKMLLELAKDVKEVKEKLNLT